MRLHIQKVPDSSVQQYISMSWWTCWCYSLGGSLLLGVLELCRDRGVLWSVEEDTWIFLCCALSISSQPFQVEFPLPSEKNIDISSPRSGLYKGCTELLGKGGRICLSLSASPLGELDTVERQTQKCLLPCSVAEQGLHVFLTLGTGLG